MMTGRIHCRWIHQRNARGGGGRREKGGDDEDDDDDDGAGRVTRARKALKSEYWKKKT